MSDSESEEFSDEEYLAAEAEAHKIEDEWGAIDGLINALTAEVGRWELFTFNERKTYGIGKWRKFING